MKTGISTASLFGRFKTEDAVEFLNKNKVQTAEVFLESFCEYNKEFGKLVNQRKGDLDINSVHTLTLQFEPQLYSQNERAKDDSFGLLENTMQSAKEFGAKYYTFHGVARVKRTPYRLDFDRIGKITQDIIDVCKKYGVSLAYENVHWCYYNYIGFFTELKKRTHGLKGTLDIKQARQSGIDYFDFLREMGSDLVTVHLSDIDCYGKMCLPGKGTTNFYELFSNLNESGFNGSLLIEAYQNDYKELDELLESLDFINNTLSKIF